MCIVLLSVVRLRGRLWEACILYVDECMMDRERQSDVTIEKNGVAVGCFLMQ